MNALSDEGFELQCFAVISDHMIQLYSTVTDYNSYHYIKIQKHRVTLHLVTSLPAMLLHAKCLHNSRRTS